MMLVRIFTTGIERTVKCIRGLPDGTKFCYSIPDTNYGIWLVVEHASFEELKDGDLIPEFPHPEMEAVLAIPLGGD